MKGKFIGAMRKSGTFKPKDQENEVKYDNLMIYALERLPENNDPNNMQIGEGYYLQVLKIKWSNVPNLVDFPINKLEDLFQFKGCDIEWFYNQFGNVDLVKFTEG